MDFGKLSSQLVAEAKKSPAKVAVLGVLALVAVYFWAPLIWNWVQPAADEAGDAEGLVVNDPAQAAPATPAAVDAAPPPRGDWQSVLKRWQEDPRARPAALAAAVRNPFQPLETARPTRRTEIAEVAPPPAASLAQLGLELTSIWLGARVRTATINGLTLPEGSLLVVNRDRSLARVAADDAASFRATDDQLAYRVAEVRPKYVVLEHNGQRLVLPLRRGGNPPSRGSAPVSTEVEEDS